MMLNAKKNYHFMLSTFLAGIATSGDFPTSIDVWSRVVTVNYFLSQSVYFDIKMFNMILNYL